MPGCRGPARQASFAYVDPDRSVIADRATLERIRALAIPPAWVSVWIAPDADAHLQATGIDRRGRKQYRYHPSWVQERDALKYRDMEDFARIQPTLRSRISSALNADRELSHVRVLALALRLLDIGLFRIGSDRYARDNAHYGLTTLHLDQVTISGGAATFDYVGKAGHRQHITITDPEALAVLSALKRRRSGPEELLAFRSPHGWTRIHREDVNNFLRSRGSRALFGEGVPDLECDGDRSRPARRRSARPPRVRRRSLLGPSLKRSATPPLSPDVPTSIRGSSASTPQVTQSSSIACPTDRGSAVQSWKPASWQASSERSACDDRGARTPAARVYRLAAGPASSGRGGCGRP